MSKYDRIQRTEPRPGGDEFEVWYGGMLKLRSPNLPEKGKNRDENATFVDTVDKAVDLLMEGYAVRVGRNGVRPSYVLMPKLKFIPA